MATTIHQGEVPREEKRGLAVIAGGSALEGLGGLAVVALAILALAGVLPVQLTEIAGIVFGAALLFEGLSLAGEYSQIGSRIPESRTGSLEIQGGTGVEVFVGLGAIALGVLALVGVSSTVLIPSLIIAGGAGLLLSAGTTARMNDLRLITAGHDSDRVRRVAHGALAGGAVTQILGGIAAIVLGILALVAIPDAAANGRGALPQIGMLVLGATLMLSGGALTGKMASMYRET